MPSCTVVDSSTWPVSSHVSKQQILCAMLVLPLNRQLYLAGFESTSRTLRYFCVS